MNQSIIAGLRTKFQNQVIELAREYIKGCNAFNKSLHASILYHGNFAICYGLNDESARLTIASGWCQQSLHSEFHCLQKFRRKYLLGKLSECDLFNVRITRRGEIKNSCPCIRCQKYLFKFQPKNIYYTTDQGNFLQL